MSVKVKIPANQKLWMTRYDGRGNPLWIIASDALLTKYYLYRVEDGKAVKVKTGKSPKDFEEEVGSV